MPLRLVSMTAKQKGELVAHSLECAPNESCALLVGKASGDEAFVSRVEVIKNVDGEPERRFSVEGGELIGRYREAENAGEEIVGIFHSHPTSRAEPSTTDKKYMAVNPVAWVIYSVSDMEMRAYTADASGKVLDAELRIA